MDIESTSPHGDDKKGNNMKKILLSLMVLCLSLGFLFSCGGGEDKPEPEKEQAEGSIFSPLTAVDVVKAEDESSLEILELLTEIREALVDKTGKFSELVSDLSAQREHEIVVGNTSRELSSLATKRLNEMIRRRARASDDEEAVLQDTVGFTVYSDGSSVAIVYSNDYLAERAVDYFIENYLFASSLTLEDGYSKTVTFSYSAMLNEEDAAITEAAWQKLSEELSDEPNGEAIVAALKNLYTIYTDDMYIWLANLYEPRQCVCEGECQNTELCSGGGFYHSNSARDNVGFAPDLYSTWAALSFISHTGMTDKGYASALPEWLKKEVGPFIYHQQAEDGYFYNPLWGKSVSADTREEMLAGGKSLLAACGLTPKYPYPGSGVRTAAKGRGASFSTSTAVLVSNVVSVSAVLPQYESVESFRFWLDNWYDSIKLGHAHFYSMGDELQSQMVNIKRYSVELGEDLVKITTDFLTSHQRENGLWDAELNYTATNAVHKIADVYNAAETEIPNPDKIISAAMDIISRDTKLDASVDLYNAWSCVPYIVKNIRMYASGDLAEREAKAEEIIADMREKAPDAIYGAFEKISVFRKLDGSFSYGPQFSSKGDPETPLAIPNTIEGDISGNGICVTSLVSQIYAALDVETFVPLYTSADLVRYMDTIASMGIPLKNEPVFESVVIDFEDCEVGENIPVEVNATNSMGKWEIAEDPDTGNKYLLMTTGTGLVAPQTHPSLKVNTQRLGVSPNYAVIEMTLQYLEERGGNEMLLYGKGGLIMQISLNVNNGVVQITNTAENSNVLASIPVSNAFKLRMEYFWTEGFIAVYINDAEEPSGVATMTYPGTGKHSEFSYLHFGSARAQEGKYLIDDICIENRQTSSAVEKPAVARKVHDFENHAVGDTAIPYFTVKQGDGSISIQGDDENKYLEHVAAPGKAQPQFVLWADARDEGANFSVIEMDMRIVDGQGSCFTMYSAAGFILQLNFTVQGECIVITNAADPLYELATAPNNGEFFKLRVEYIHSLGEAAIYINGEDTPSGITSKLPSNSKGHGLLTRIFYYSGNNESCTSHIDNISVENYKRDISEGHPETSNPQSSTVDFENETRYPSGNITNSNFATAAIKLTKYGTYFGSEQVAITEKGENRYFTVINGKDYEGSQSLQMYPASLTSGTLNANVLEMKMNVTSTVTDADIGVFHYRIKGTSTNTLPIYFRTEKTADGDQVVVSFTAPSGKRVYAVAGKVGEDFVLRIEYYYTLGAAKIFINGERIATVHDSDSCATFTTGIERLFIMGNSAAYTKAGDNSALSFDYITFEEKNLTYTSDAVDYPGVRNPEAAETLPDPEPDPDPKPDPEPEPEPDPEPEEEDKGMTFDDALLGTFDPADVDPQLFVYDGASITVVEKGSGQAIKVNGSGVNMKPVNDLAAGEKANATVFEATLNYSTLAGSGLDSFWFRQTGSGTPMFKVVTREYGGGKIGIKLIYGTTEAPYNTSLNIGVNSDFRIRVVYMWETGVTTVSVNGTLLFTETSPSIAEDGSMDRVIFLNNTANEKTLDNIVFTSVYIPE